MTNNPVRQALLARKVTFGTWLQIGHATASEVLAKVGFDWIAADCEHTDIDVEVFTTLARGMYGRGPVPLARVRENDTLAIRQMLDAGAQGVIVPLVNSAAEAKRAVAAAKFPPMGVRGFSFARMNNYGVDFDEYAKNANNDIAVVVMIESKQAVEHIDEILAVEGVDGIFIGPYDLTGSYGIPGQLGAPVITEARRTILDACRRAGKAAGLHIVTPTPESIKATIAEGFTFIGLGVDTIFLRQAALSALQTARAAAGS